ncbi:MAG: glycosyltransferase family 4 protein [Pedobacter sp.]
MNAVGEKIHVVHLIGSTGLYGAERWILALMRALDPDKVQSTLINLVDDQNEVSEVVSAAHQRGLAAMDFYTGGKFNPFSAVRMARWVREQNVRIIHGHGFKSDGFGLLTSRMAGCRMMTTPHGWSVEKDRKLQLYEQLDRLLFRFMDLVCPLSPELAEGLKDSTVAAKLRLVYNGVDIDEVRAAQSREKRHTEDFVIGYIGRLVKLKNLETLLNSFHILKAERPNVRLMIVGDGPERSNLESQAKQLGIGEQVEFLGFREDAVAFLKEFDVFVLPSLSEGIPRCIMEAMAASVPVVVSDIPGNRNLVSHGDTGLIFSTDDSCGLAELLVQIMDNPAEAAAMAIRGNRKVEEQYSNRKMAAEYTRLYQELLDPHA